MTQKNIWRWTSLKKNKKSVPTEKKFWIISIAVGICLVVLSVCFFSNVDKEKIEADKVSGNKAVISEFEKFLSVYLYCDIKGDGYKAIMGDFIKNINKTYKADSCFFKLLAYYYSSTTPSDDNSIVNLLADLYIKVNANKNSNKRINKSALIQKFKKEKAELE